MIVIGTFVVMLSSSKKFVIVCVSNSVIFAKVLHAQGAYARVAHVAHLVYWNETKNAYKNYQSTHQHFPNRPI